MLVVFHFLMLMDIVMVMLAVPRKAVFRLLRRIHAVHQRHHLHVGRINGFQHVSHPFIRFSPDIQKNIAVLYGDDILRGRLVAVHLGSGLQKHFHLCILPGYLPGKIIQRENRSHDLRFFLLLRL